MNLRKLRKPYLLIIAHPISTIIIKTKTKTVEILSPILYKIHDPQETMRQPSAERSALLWQPATKSSTICLNVLACDYFHVVFLAWHHQTIRRFCGAPNEILRRWRTTLYPPGGTRRPIRPSNRILWVTRETSLVAVSRTQGKGTISKAI